MPRRLLSAALALLLSAVLPALGQTHRSIPSLLNDFDKALRNAQTVYGTKKAAADELRRTLDGRPADSAHVAGLIKLGDMYSTLSADSAFAAYTRAKVMARTLGMEMAVPGINARRSNILSLQGQEALAVRIFESIDPDSVAPADKEVYHLAGRRIYITLADLSRSEENRRYFRALCRVHNDSLLALVPDSAVMHDMLMATVHKLDGKLSMQLAYLNNVLNRPDAPPHLKSVAAYWAGTYYSRVNGADSPEAGKHYLIASVYDLQNGELTSQALYALSRWLHATGDYERSYAALLKAVENGRSSGAANPWVGPAQMASMVIQTHERIDRIMIWLIAGMAVLLVGLSVGFVLLIRRQRRQRAEITRLRAGIENMELTRRSYVKQFLNLCGVYMERLEGYDKMVRRKIAAGQTDELYKLLKSGKLLSEQSEMYFAVLDNAFTHLYPDFVENVNSLLEPDKRIVIAEKGALTPELRILSFSILGLDDTQRVAKFLGLSVNTVYAYRNKLRSRAINRDTFEADIQRLCSEG